MSRAFKYEYQGEQFTIKQLAEMKGLSGNRMRDLVKELGVDGAMKYTAPPRKMRTFNYKGKQLNIHQLVEIAREKCTPNSMRRRIKLYGVEFAVEHDDWETLRITGYQLRAEKPISEPTIPEFDPEMHMLENMVSSLQEQGMPLSDIYSEVRKRLAA